MRWPEFGTHSQHSETAVDLKEQNPKTLDPEEWVDEYGDYLYRYATSRLRDASAAEEVLQETFLSGIRHLEQFSGRGSQRGWLLGIMKRKIVDYIRQRSRYDRDHSYSNESDPSLRLFDEMGAWRNVESLGASPDDKIESRELWQVVRECLQNLPVSQADVFTLSVMEEMDAEDICCQLDITPNNYWVRMHRARLGLASCVGSRWFQETEVATHAQ